MGVHNPALDQAEDAAASIARAFIAARSTGSALTAYPGPIPADLAAAYHVQDLALALDGRAVAGWKVGRINAPDDARLGQNRLAGPIFAAETIAAAAGELPAMPVFAGGFAAVEAEFMLHVAPGFAGALPADDAATLTVIDDIRLGIEVASSPYPRINADGPTVTASDFGNNAGLVLGPRLDGWAGIDLCAVEVTMEIDGHEAGRATARTMLDGPLGAVRFLLGHLRTRGIASDAGLWVSTGAITGVHQIAPGSTAKATFGPHGALGCRTVARRPG
jgi:2-keto-4-pentenoate hydratase